MSTAWEFAKGKHPSTTIKINDQRLFVPRFAYDRANSTDVRLIGNFEESPKFISQGMIKIPYKIRPPATCTAFLDTENFKFDDETEWFRLVNYVKETWKSDLIWCDGFATNGKYGPVYEKIRSRIIATRVIIHLNEFFTVSGNPPDRDRHTLKFSPCLEGAVACIARYFVGTTDMKRIEIMRKESWKLNAGIVTHIDISGDEAYNEISDKYRYTKGDAHCGMVKLLIPNLGDCRQMEIGHEAGVETLLTGCGPAGCKLRCLAAVLHHVGMALSDSKNDCSEIVHTIVSRATIKLLQKNRRFRLFGGDGADCLCNVLGLLDNERRLFWLRKKSNDLDLEEQRNQELMYHMCFAAGVPQDAIRGLKFDCVDSIHTTGESFERKLVIDLVCRQTIYSMRLKAAPMYSYLLGLALEQRTSDNSVHGYEG
jgi:hypothetical protein